MNPLQFLPSLILTGALHGSAEHAKAVPDILGAGTMSPINPTHIALLAGGLVILLVVAARLRRGRVALTRSDDRRHHAVDERTLRELEAVMAQLDQLSRQIHGKIDLKLATLQKVIRDADQRIEDLSRLQRGVQGEARLDIQLESEVPNQAMENNESRHDAVYRMADSGYTPLQIARELARHTGEVELILSLRRAKRAPEFGPTTNARKQAS